jgi:8-oxo-dGTP diphosphatase
MRKTVSTLWKKLPGRVRTLISRAAHPTFTVSVAGIITNTRGRVLLLDHVLRPSSGWGLPGGFINKGEMPAVAFERELFEETGIQMTDVKIYRASTFKRHVEILFTARTIDEPRVLSREIYELGWFHADELPTEMNLAQQLIIREVLCPKV